MMIYLFSVDWIIPSENNMILHFALDKKHKQERRNIILYSTELQYITTVWEIQMKAALLMRLMGRFYRVPEMEIHQPTKRVGAFCEANIPRQKWVFGWVYINEWVQEMMYSTDGTQGMVNLSSGIGAHSTKTKSKMKSFGQGQAELAFQSHT